MAFRRSWRRMAEYSDTTIICVARSGGRYDATWVDRLYRGARRHLPSATRFVCLTDLPVDVQGVERIALRHDWPRWWAKMEAFRPDLGTGRRILLDLDTILLANASDLLSGSGTLAMEDFFHRGRVSTAVLVFDGASLAHVYHRFAERPDRWMTAGSCGEVPNAVHGDQVVIDHFLRDAGEPVRFVQREHPGLLEFHSTQRVPRGPILVFIGDSKPDTAPEPVPTLWRGEGMRLAA